MSILNEKELLQIQIDNLKLTIKRKTDEIKKIKEEYAKDIVKIRKEYGVELLELRMSVSAKTTREDNSVPILCDALNSITGVSGKDILSNSRRRDYIIPRYIICHILRMEGKTLQAIGRDMVHQHHSTIIHAVKSVENWFIYKDYYKKEIDIYNKTKKMYDNIKN